MRKIVHSGRICLASVTLAVAAGTVNAGVINVPADFATIQSAVNAAVDGDEVVVANGVYNTDVDIVNKSITLRSAANSPNFCVINAPGAIGVFISGAGETSIVRGFKIRNGLRGVEVNASASASIENCIVEDHSIGGMFMNGVALTVANTTIRNNAATNAGGGILIAQGDVTLRSSNFVGNAVIGVNAFGGGVHVAADGRLVAVDCIFLNNTAIGNNLGRGGALYASGGATLPPITIMNTVFDDNEASERGGALYVEFRDAVLGTVEVINNTAIAGGGLFLENSGGAPNSFVIANALVANNVATNGSGGGIRNSADSLLTITNATIMGNTSVGSGGGGVANGPNSIATVSNCIVGGSSPNDFAGTGTTLVTYSNVEDGFAGLGNISESPLFIDVTAGDYRLAAGSPCIDAGNTTATMGPATDLDGNARIVDDPVSTNTGFAFSNGAIDMGAYERQLVDTCPADVNDTGEVNIDDLFGVIGAWGSCP